MAGIRLTPAERQDLLDHYRRSADPASGHRAHILLLLAAARTAWNVASSTARGK